MRVSLRRAAKVTAVVFVIIITNFIICYQVSQHVETSRSVRNENSDNGRNGGVIIGSHFQSGPQLVKMKDSNSNSHNFGITDSKFRKTSKKTELNPNLRETGLSDLFISVKTTGVNHATRLRTALDTWIMLARQQTHIFTDTDDPNLQNEIGVDIINTKCLPSHYRRALCCKMAIEYDTFLASNKRWFCHVDDDNYVNVPQLLRLLQKYNHTGDWYLGKPSLKDPIEIMDRRHNGRKVAFWFATGGAGFCISRGMALKMMPYASGGRLMTIGDSIRLPDDCTVGYIICHLLNKELTVISLFHSHLESLNFLRKQNLNSQIILSYNIEKDNIIKISGFDKQQDPSRFRSLHCFLFPTFRECKKMTVNT